MSDADTIRRLRAELDEANEMIRQLLEQLADRADELPDWLPPLTAKEHALLDLLSDGRLYSRPQVMNALYPQSADSPLDKIIDAFICRLRAKLKPFGLTIETQWGRGRQMTRESVERLWAQPAADASHHSAVHGAAEARAA